MRVIAGRLKGKPLVFEKNPAVRPMTQKVREAVFNIIGWRIEGACFLDLFCGSGSVGIEALSRGAAHVDFVDLNTRTVLRNVNELGLSQTVHVYRRDVFRALGLLPTLQKSYDIVFAGPPYAYSRSEEVLVAIEESRMLVSEGIFLLEHMWSKDYPDDLPKLTLRKTYKYGQTAISRYESLS